MRNLCLFLMGLFFGTKAAVAQPYTYDNNHQIVQIKYSGNTTLALQYDANGNRISYNVTTGPLPITLLSFNAQKSGEQVLLTWSTSIEINTDKFDIEFSKEGVTFSSFTTVPAQGNSSTRQDYSTIHCCPVEGVNFYRLKMLDKDGSFKYSEIRKVVFEFENILKVFPNPNAKNSDLTITFKKPFLSNGNIAFYNSLGALVYNSVLNKGETKKTINTKGLSAGKYSIIVDVDSKTYKTDFIEQ